MSRIFLRTAWELGTHFVQLHTPYGDTAPYCARCGEQWPCRSRAWGESFVHDCQPPARHSAEVVRRW